VWLGIGMGGFFDGIALHQIAQWHNMLSAKVPPRDMGAMSTNMTADGWFHAATWIVTLIGIFRLLDAARGEGTAITRRAFVGRMLLGWGGFNLVEGLVDHHLLELHHVRDLPQHVPAYDWAFLAVAGAGIAVFGWLLSRDSTRSATRPPLTSS
jgi:uncharacterized membrane protein